MKGHRTIPVFTPELACPFRCSYCNQHRITAKEKVTEPEEVPSIISKHLSTIDPKKFRVEVGFFGGSFTGLSPAVQADYLSKVEPYIENGNIDGVRLSTRPDYISKENLRLLKDHGVTTIELGAQSMNDKVLEMANRGHDADATRLASAMIISAGFRLGLQMMVGLPGSDRATEMETAREFVRLGANETRIYPVLVLRETELEKLYIAGSFAPLDLSQAALRSAMLIEYFSQNGVTVLRTGLHPSHELLEGDSLIAGPFHPSFGSIARSKLWQIKLRPLSLKSGDELILQVPAGSEADAAGFRKENRDMLERSFRRVSFFPEASLKAFQFHADIR